MAVKLKQLGCTKPTRWLWWLITAVLLRAVIPAGYMPASERQATTPLITMCVVGLSGPTVVYLDLDGQTPRTHETHPALDCVYGAVLQLDNLHTKLPILVVGLLMLLWRLTTPLLRRPCFKSGPPIGPRGPPAYS